MLPGESEPIILLTEYEIFHREFREATMDQPMELDDLYNFARRFFQDTAGAVYKEMPEWRRAQVKGSEEDLAKQCVDVLFLVLQGLSAKGAVEKHTNSFIEDEFISGEDFDESVWDESAGVSD
jgi:hypothetical protein